VSLQRIPPTVRRFIVPAVVIALAAVALIMFRDPLMVWFTGKPLGGSEGTAVTAHAGPFTIRASLSPDPPGQKDQTLVLTIRDASGSAVDDATIDVVYDMPAMGAMAEMKGGARIAHDGQGRYRAEFDLPMAGNWTLRASVRASSGSASQGLALTVGTPGLTLVGEGGGSASNAMSSGGGPAPIQYPPLAFDALRSAMDSYDRARAKLTGDDIQGVGGDARGMVDALRAAHDALSDRRGDLVDATTAAREAAERLANVGSVDDARKQFAALSRALLPIVAADTRLTAGWHVFECPMFEGHPHWMQRRDAPDNPYMGSKMPSCGSAEEWNAPAAVASPSASTPGEIDHYTCSMHPSVKQSGPGTCPICGMNLIPVTKEQQEQGVVLIDEARRQLIGVRTEPVVQAPLRETFRAVGHVAYDESTLADVNLKVHGWITKLYVNETGQHVERGQTLFTMYSPEVYNAEQDLLLATRGASAASHGVDVERPQAARAAVASSTEGAPNRTDLFKSAARQRLHLLGLMDAQIDTIAQNGKPSEDLAIPSPASGFVIEKNVVEGASVDAGMRLYRIAALGKVWVEAEVYESDLAHVRTGQRATVTLDYLPGRAYEAKVAYVYPYLDPTSRTGRVRFEIANKQLELRPGMYASVELGADLGPRVQVPTSAIVYTGPRRLAFVDLGGGRFRPTEVHVGIESNGMYEVLAGLMPGDVVATSGIFLIAAEARISTAAKYWDTASDELDAAPAPTATPELPLPEPPGTSRSMPTPHQRAGPAAPVASSPASSAMSSSQPAIDYTCPMHPEVHSTTPGKCPKCDMDLEPRPRQP
jgi:membrane fusion protein, copper/silver efflux system